MAFLKRKRFKFSVDLELLQLSDVPLVNAVLFAKVRLLSGGNFVSMTEKVEVRDHAAVWNHRASFSCRIGLDPDTGVLEKCECRISLRKETRNGKSFTKLGFVDVNLSEFAASGMQGIAESYLLDGYGMNQRQDNSRLFIRVTMSHLNAYPIFKVPRNQESHIEELNPLDRKAPSGGNEPQFNRKTSGTESDSNNSSSVEDTSHVLDDMCASPVTIAALPIDGHRINNLPPIHSVSSTHSTCSLQPLELHRTQNNVSASKRLGQERSQLNKAESGKGTNRVQATRVDPKVVIERMVENVVQEIERADIADGSEGLTLYVSKDGEAVIAGNSNHSSDAFERVQIADNTTSLSTG